MRWWCEEIVKVEDVFIGGNGNLGFICTKCSQKMCKNGVKSMLNDEPPSKKRVFELRPLATAAWVNSRHRPEVSDLSHAEL